MPPSGITASQFPALDAVTTNVDYKRHPHTEKLHTIERCTRTDLGHMTIETTIDDPGAYEKPFTAVGPAQLMVGQQLMEYICQENNQDLPRLSGPARGPGAE